MAEEAPVQKFVSIRGLNRMAGMPKMRGDRAVQRGDLPIAAYVDLRPIFDPNDPEVKAFIERKGLPLGNQQRPGITGRHE